MDLFDAGQREHSDREQPLASRLRPQTLDEFVGQDHILGRGRLLRRAIQADQLSSVIFYGPSGTGKTTLAAVIANTTRSHFITINAVLAGVAEIRQAIADAQEYRKLYRRRTILFVDEVHRFNKSQQDALLPWVENGLLILVGATTENPYFSVNRPLLSRSRVFQLKRLEPDDLRRIARRALTDPRGYGGRPVELQDDALEHLVDVANGDARALLNALELAAETTTPAADGTVRITLAVAEESIQRRAVLYDKEGDYHFDTISAFIKSLRGSDPDAAMYWLARMVYAGEDPDFILRRMLIFASEDVGLADPQALPLVAAAAAAFDRVGMPEGRFALAHAALYLATAPKSNSAFAFFDALAAVEREHDDEVPAHLKDASRDQEGFGHGANYLYPHAYRDHWVAQQYLPARMQGRLFYQPTEQGHERRIGAAVRRRRELQLAAMLDTAEAPTEVLTHSPPQRERDRWLQRAAGDQAAALAVLRERVLGALRLQRHDRVLDLCAGTGLLTWEALRRVPEGGVWAWAADRATAIALQELAARLPEAERPAVLSGSLTELAALLEAHTPGLRLDAIMGRNALGPEPDKPAVLAQLRQVAAPGARVSLAETVWNAAQRLYALIDLDRLKIEGLGDRLVQAEEAIYAADEPRLRWTPESRQQLPRKIPRQLLAQWFSPGGEKRRTYATHLAATLDEREMAAVRRAFEEQIGLETVSWTTTVAYLVASA